jgi:hypothetical protein
MRVVVTSSKSWQDVQAVIDAVCQLPASSTVLLPSRRGACAIVQEYSQELKIETEDWSTEEDDYDSRGSSTNAAVLASDVDMCIAFLSPDAHAARDCVRQARLKDLDVQVVGK